MAYEHIIETSTGDLIRAGYNVTAGAGETKRTDGPVPATRRTAGKSGTYDHWNGSAWDKKSQPPDEHGVIDGGLDTDELNTAAGGVICGGVIQSLQDLESLDSDYGLILIDRTTGDRWRVYMNNGTLSTENLDA